MRLNSESKIYAAFLISNQTKFGVMIFRPFQVVYQPHIPSHYVSPTVTPTAYSAALSHDVIGPGNMLNVSNGKMNYAKQI